MIRPTLDACERGGARVEAAVLAPWRGVDRAVRAGRVLANDPGLPRWLRRLALFGALPIPGPADEAALLVVVACCGFAYRANVRAAWEVARVK